MYAVAVYTAPQTESFEQVDWTRGTILRPATGSRSDWERGSGQTPSGSTGPAAAHDGVWYLFAKASSQTDQEFVLELFLPLHVGSVYSLVFWYHMHGADMGTLSVEMGAFAAAELTPPSWTVLWSVTGEQQPSMADPWRQEQVCFPTTAYLYSGPAIVSLVARVCPCAYVAACLHACISESLTRMRGSRAVLQWLLCTAGLNRPGNAVTCSERRRSRGSDQGRDGLGLPLRHRH